MTEKIYTFIFCFAQIKKKASKIKNIGQKYVNIKSQSVVFENNIFFKTMLLP